MTAPSAASTAELPAVSAVSADHLTAGLPRLLAGLPAAPDPQAALADHLRERGLPPRRPDPAALLAEVSAAGLAGRGGAAFPTARKLAAVRAAGGGATAAVRAGAVRDNVGGGTVVVANGAEGEPASRKDAALLWHAPHLVLDGLQLAAAACGASTAILCIHGGQPGLRWHLESAIGARHAAGLDPLATWVRELPQRFLAGEETALTGYLNGGAAVPAFKQHRVFERGVAGRPTLVQNVETLAHLALIARHGAAWFRAVGTDSEPGSVLCTITDADRSTRVAEAALGTGIGQLLRIDGGVQAVLAGGYHGGWLTPQEARMLRLSNADLKPAGAFVGAGVLAALPSGVCGLAETADVVRYLALESAGQCGPCLNGLPRIAAALATLARPRPAAAELANLTRWSGLVAGRGACHHPDGTARFVSSALRVFAAEITAHGRGRCTAATGTTFLPIPAAAAAESDWR